MGKKKTVFLLLIFTCLIIMTSYSETVMSYAESQLENILTAYAGKEASLSDQLQIVQNDVNFREAPGGKALGRLQGGTILDCLDEIQRRTLVPRPVSGIWRRICDMHLCQTHLEQYELVAVIRNGGRGIGQHGSLCILDGFLSARPWPFSD